MVEAFAVASGKGGTGKTTSTLALGMALAEEHDVTVVDADTGMANLLFHAGLSEADPTLHDVLIEEGANVEAATYDRFGMRVVPCGTSLTAFEAADPARLRAVVADLAADADVLLLDSPATLASKSAVLPVVLADRTVIVLEPTVPALSDGLKVQEYALSYGTDVAGVLFNKVRDGHVGGGTNSNGGAADRHGGGDDRNEGGDDRRGRSAGGPIAKAERYFEGPTLARVPESDAVRRARSAGEPLLAHAPDAPASRAYRAAAAALDVQPGDEGDVADRFRSAVIPDPP